MSQPVSQLSQRKSYLSPQFARTVRTIQSPKFDKQKADQQHLKRKFIYEEKLARYDQYNSILSAKVQKQISSTNTNNKSRIQTHQNITKNYQPKPIINSKIQPDTQSRLITCPKPPKKQQLNLNSMRQKNRTLHQRNAQLKSYLNEINTGVSELECILQEVQETYNSLKQIKPQEFNGLWFMNDHLEEDENLKSQKQTKDTVDFDYDRTGSFRNLAYSNQSSPKTKVNHVKCENSKARNKLEMINLMQSKFKQILQKITKRQMFQLKIDSQISQLNALEKEIDQLRQDHSSKNLKTSISHKNLQPTIGNPAQLVQLNQTLSKVKSLGRLLS